MGETIESFRLENQSDWRAALLRKMFPYIYVSLSFWIMAIVPYALASVLNSFGCSGALHGSFAFRVNWDSNEAYVIQLTLYGSKEVLKKRTPNGVLFSKGYLVFTKRWL